MSESEIQKFDVIIVGAGPAGTTCALALRNSNLKVALIEKNEFPRSKICGDAIPGPAFKTMESLSENFGADLWAFAESSRITASKIVFSEGKEFVMDWVTKSYNSKRIDFDDFLFEKVKNETGTEIFQNEKIEKVEVEKLKVSAYSKKSIYEAKILIAADGANGVCAKQLTGFRMDRAHHAGAVRAYFKNVSGLKDGMNEFHLLEEHLPGYLWIFPLNEGFVNVGFGMLSKKISDSKINLKKTMENILKTNEKLKNRFKNAEQVGKITGFGLPFGSRFAQLSGDRFLLCGDAGSLIDPLFGHGIDKAMISGKIAAEVIEKSFETNRFGASFLKKYEHLVYQKLSFDFKKNYFLMKILGRFPGLLKILSFLNGNQYAKQLFRKFS